MGKLNCESKKSLKTDYTQQIVSIKERRGNLCCDILLYRLSSINEALAACKGSNSIELYKYIPISLVATMEAFFRATVRLLIDHDIIYMDNAAKIPSLKTNKFDFEILKAIQGKVISGSELISHLIRINNFDDINTIMTNILDENFLNELNTFKQSDYRAGLKLLNNERININKFRADSEKIKKMVIKTFELRHIFCHEVPSFDYQVNQTEIESCFNSVSIFLNVCNEYINNLLHPNTPLTQTDMNVESYNKYKNLEDNMNNLIDQVRVIFKDDIDFLRAFDYSQVKWLEYVDAFMKARFPKDDTRRNYGSVYPLCVNSERADLTNHRIKQIIGWVDGTSEGNCCVGSYRAVQV